MLFTFKYKHYDYRHLKSGQVRKLLSALKYSVAGQKALIQKAITAYREGRPHYHVENIPHICVEPGTVAHPKKIESDEPHVKLPSGCLEAA